MSRALSSLSRLSLLVCWLISTAPNAYASPCFSEASARASSWDLLDRGDYATLDARLSAAQSSYRAGSINDVQLQAVFLLLCDNDASLRVRYDAWVAALPGSYVARLARANYLRNQGWNARGDEYASLTSDARFAAMEKFNRDARKDYQDSLALERRPILSYSGLVDLSRHGGSSGDDVLDAALRIDPKTFVVRRVYMSSLQTRWHGSVEEMEQFAAESKPHITASQAHVLDAMVIEDRSWNIEQAGDELAAAHLFQSAVERVDDPAQANGGWYGELTFETGWAYQHANDLPTAIVWFRRAVAVTPKNQHALSNLAWTLQKTGQATEAASYYQKSAELGDSWAQDQYGKCLWFGLGIPKDQPAAVPYFSRSAAAGSDEALKDLYWATRQLNLPPQGSLTGAAKPAANAPPVNKPVPAAPRDLGPTDS